MGAAYNYRKLTKKKAPPKRGRWAGALLLALLHDLLDLVAVLVDHLARTLVRRESLERNAVLAREVEQHVIELELVGVDGLAVLVVRRHA